MGKINASEVSEKAKSKLRPTVKMGGSVTRNGKNVDKEIEAQTARKRTTSDGYMPRVKENMIQYNKERGSKMSPLETSVRKHNKKVTKEDLKQ
jgi:hypothetical protein